MQCVRWLALLAMVALVLGAPPPASRRSSGKRARAEKKQRARGRIRPFSHQFRRSYTDDDAVLTEDFLKKYGYFRKGKPLNLQIGASTSGQGEDRPDATPSSSEALRVFQSYFGLDPTGKMDKQTVALMRKGRCGVADIPEEIQDSNQKQSPSDFSLLGPKWEKQTLSWKLEIPTSQLSRGNQRRIIREAFDVWRGAAPLEFRESRQDDVDIHIQFGAMDHKDGYPFDGPGMVLAHAFGPGDYSLAGDMHLDDDETWTVGHQDSGSDLKLVAIHELGHSLGLSHSRDPGAIMYPYYGQKGELGQDDIRGIQSLYGVRLGLPSTTPSPRTTPTTTRRSVTDMGAHTKSATYTSRPHTETTTQASAKKVEFDVVIQEDSKDPDVYTGIHNDEVFRFNRQGLVVNHPSSLRATYPGAPIGADAVFAIPETSSTYFIKDNQVWRYHHTQLDDGFPKRLEPSHFPETIRFVLPLVAPTGQRRIFVFGKTLWLEYNFDDPPPKSHKPRPYVIPQYWPTVSADVNYAVMGPDNYIYFVSPHSHVVLDGFRRVMFGGKQEGVPNWMQPVYSTDSSGSVVSYSWGQVSLAVIVTLLLLHRQ